MSQSEDQRERRSPFEDVEEMLDRMSQRFEQLREREGEHATPAVDISETDGAFTVTVDLPGFEEEDIDLRVRDNTLHVHAKHEEETEPEEAEGEYLRRERRQRTFSRSIPLPEPVDKEAATATTENGVLTVTLPKADEEEVGYTISISE